MLWVNAPVAPTAAFSADPLTGEWPLKVQFTDASTGTGPFTYKWDFGDGQTSTEQNPSHTYATVGTYAVTLKVTSDWATDDATTAITVTKATPTLALTINGESSSLNLRRAIR